MCIWVYNLEFHNTLDGYLYFYVSFMRFVKVIFFPMKFYKKIYLHGKFITKFISFLWMNKFLIMKNIFSPRLVKRESCGSSHCIFQSF